MDINDIYWGFSNKFQLFIGVINNINKKYDKIIWFPQGTFVINSFNSSYTTNDYQISISGQDKMCLLNGTIGGNIPMKVNFGIEKYIDDMIFAEGEFFAQHIDTDRITIILMDVFVNQFGYYRIHFCLG